MIFNFDVNWVLAGQIVLRNATVHRFMHHSSWLHNLWSIHKLPMVSTLWSTFQVGRVLLSCDIPTNNAKSTRILNLSLCTIWVCKQTILYWTSVLYWVILHSIIWCSIWKLIHTTLQDLPVLHRAILCLLTIIILRIVHAYRLNCFERCLVCGRVWNIGLLF